MPVEVAVVRADDYEELASFMAAFPGVRACSIPGWRSRLRAWWDANPAFDESIPRGWLVRDNGKIGGFFGSLPLKIQVGGREMQAFAATSWRVLPAYRGKSMSLKLRQLDAHRQALHFSTTPKPERVPLLRRLGYQPIPRGPRTELQSHFILDFEKFLRGPAHSRLFHGIGARIAAPVLAAVQAFRTRALTRFASADVRDLAHADASFDDLWQRTRTRYANTNIRTAELLNWYCFAIAPADKRLLGFYERDRLLGYLVLWMKKEPVRQFLECVDLWIDPAAGQARVLAGLVAKAVACARKERFERIIFPHFDTATASLYGSVGLLEGPVWKKREFLRAPRDVMEGITLENSYFVRAQGDYGL
jgi:hypothetical protein